MREDINLAEHDIDPYGGRTHLSEPVLPFNYSKYSHIGAVMKDTFSAIGHLVSPDVVEEQSEPEEMVYGDCNDETGTQVDLAPTNAQIRPNLRRITSKVGSSTVELYPVALPASSNSSAAPCLQCPVCRKVVFLRGHLPSGSTAKCDCRVCGLLADGNQLAFVNPSSKGKLINAGIGAFCRQCRRQSPSLRDLQGLESSGTPNIVVSNSGGHIHADLQAVSEDPVVSINPSIPGVVKLQ